MPRLGGLCLATIHRDHDRASKRLLTLARSANTGVSVARVDPEQVSWTVGNTALQHRLSGIGTCAVYPVDELTIFL